MIPTNQELLRLVKELFAAKALKPYKGTRRSKRWKLAKLQEAKEKHAGPPTPQA